MGNLFGTDGVRGVANVHLTPELALSLARAMAKVKVRRGGCVIIGRDTRTSGPMIEAGLSAGFASAGVDVRLAGVIPTPAISFLIKDERADLGAVISASHNPPQDNGIKFFDRRGMKLTIDEERAVEQAIGCDVPAGENRLHVGSIGPLDAAATRYAAFLAGTIDVEEVDLTGIRVVVDCAFGATGRIAPHVLRHLGAEVIELHSEADGTRINQGCGSTDLCVVQAEVERTGAELGIAFDGDGDRVLLVTSDGTTIDGDQMIGIAALHMKRAGRLKPPAVVVTELSNLGLEKMLSEHGITAMRTPVGDRHVAQQMFVHGAKIGGEPSGHIIFGDYSPTGDGILTAVKLLEIAHDSRMTLGELAQGIPLYPQRQRSIPSTDPMALLQRSGVRRAVERAEESLQGIGRVMLRASGTQPVVRILVEALDQDVVTAVSEALEAAIHAQAAASS